MNVLVTGGAGFIGSHLCEYLLSEGDKVTCVDNLFTGSKENIKGFLDNERFSFLLHDIKEPLFIKDKIIDQVYNLACPASPVHYQLNAISTIKSNLMGSINMLGLAKRHRARILQASTSEVYGDPLEHPQKETYLGNVNCISRRACYDEGKRVAETLFFDYHRQHGVDIRVARIFNTYGPRMQPNDGRVVSNFIVQALQNKPITIYGNGMQTRSFCYVDDLVEGLHRLMNCKGFTGPVNLGNPGEFTINELADIIIKKTGSTSQLVHENLPEGDPKVRKPDINLAREKLGWEPAVKLEDGLDPTIDYFSRIT